MNTIDQRLIDNELYQAAIVLQLSDLEDIPDEYMSDSIAAEYVHLQDRLRRLQSEAAAMIDTRNLHKNLTD
jgi:hypothetical protein